jgi:hypothetical protein
MDLTSLMEDGTSILALTTLKPGVPLQLKLCGVERGGIWVENQELTDTILETLNESALPVQPIFFVPYSSIVWAVAAIEGQSLSAEKLGL